MPYINNQDLPESISAHLPEHALSIFRKSFNSAIQEYNNEITAFKVAWAAVKEKYEKNENGVWVEK